MCHAPDRTGDRPSSGELSTRSSSRSTCRPIAPGHTPTTLVTPTLPCRRARFGDTCPTWTAGRIKHPCSPRNPVDSTPNLTLTPCFPRNPVNPTLLPSRSPGPHPQATEACIDRSLSPPTGLTSPGTSVDGRTEAPTPPAHPNPTEKPTPTPQYGLFDSKHRTGLAGVLHGRYTGRLSRAISR